MAFEKYAAASVVQSEIGADAWCNIRQASMGAAGKIADLRAAKVTLDKMDPKRFMLSHCTIIASVDTEKAPGLIGKHLLDGFEVNRQYPDYYLKRGTEKYVNNNNDCWERKLLLASHKTFIGGENYVEHIQIPEMSKGKLLDAAARNIGDSIYVDILVATERKHKPLISAIISGQLGTLSMGCSVDFTICTKCGNVAEDETQLCTHIKYFKGQEFIDEMGQTRKIAELCGHVDAEPGSVKFIEASWVANPAFKGAVLRNILTEEQVAQVSGLPAIAAALQAPTRLPSPGAMQRAARLGDQDFDFEDQDQGDTQQTQQQQTQQQAPAQQTQQQEPAQQQQQAPAQQTQQQDSLDSVVNDLVENVTDKVKNQVRDDIEDSDANQMRRVLDENASNESLIKSSLINSEWRRVARRVTALVGKSRAKRILLGLLFHEKGGWQAVKASKQFSGIDILVLSRVHDQMTKRSSIAGEARVYRTVVAVGGTGPYEDVETYLTACRQTLGRKLTGSEAAVLLEKGRLFSSGS